MTRWVTLGRILAPHGVQGFVKIQSFCATPQALFNYCPARVHQTLVSAWHDVKPLARGLFLARCPELGHQREALMRWRGQDICALRDQLPPPGPEEVYYADLLGCGVRLREGALAGQVVDIHNFGAGDILEIRPTDQRETVFVGFNQVLQVGKEEILLDCDSLA